MGGTDKQKLAQEVMKDPCSGDTGGNKTLLFGNPEKG